MLKIKLNDHWYEWEYDGIKLIECNNCSWTIKKLLFNIMQNDSIEINNKKITKSNIIFVNEFTKIADLLSLNKSNLFFKEINSLIDFSKLVDEKAGIEIKENINNMINEKEFIDFEIDINSLISLFFSLNKNLYLNKINFKEILKIYKKSIEKCTLIISNTDFIKIEDLMNYVDWFNFIIFTNDVRNEINNFDNLNEIICIENNNGIFNEFTDLEKLFLYIEEKVKDKFDIETANSFVNPKINNKNYENWQKNVKNI